MVAEFAQADETEGVGLSHPLVKQGRENSLVILERTYEESVGTADILACMECLNLEGFCTCDNPPILWPIAHVIASLRAELGQ